MAVCQISLVGNLGRDPEVRYGKDNRGATTLSVAVSNATKNSDGTWTDETDWFRVTVWGEKGERIAEKLKKGSRVFVAGRFRTRSYEKDGQTRVSLEVTADQVLGLDKADKAGGELDGLAF